LEEEYFYGTWKAFGVLDGDSGLFFELEEILGGCGMGEGRLEDLFFFAWCHVEDICEPKWCHRERKRW
jgi:hypothetical protein